ncbi:MAG: CDGSH iron-sulfur domain-containing protein [Deltaproteobacteria bacterium]|nr:CDGSH iron-sulfur domain-containing protein [Deltaproteobacteria bacterium]
MNDRPANGITIEIMEDGPLIVKGLTILKNSKGEEVEAEMITALCRCGGSPNKPFCDGTHKKVGFFANRETDKPIDKEREYQGEDIAIYDNRVICSHAGECVRNLPSVFRLGERPWIAPDNASVEEIISVIKKCPSGALSYSVQSTHQRDFDHSPEIVITKNGPYSVTGNIKINIEEDLQPPSREHFALCRCGASKNKPYCDGSHTEAGFTDEDN